LQLCHVGPQSGFAALLDDGAGALSPEIDLIGEHRLLGPQRRLFALELGAVFPANFEHLAADGFQLLADRYELVLDLVRFLVEGVLNLSQANPEHGNLPPPPFRRDFAAPMR
jgi:hypothetical protein